MRRRIVIACVVLAAVAGGESIGAAHASSQVEPWVVGVSSSMTLTGAGEGSAFAPAPGTSVATFSSLSFVGATAADFSATINWGDGASNPGAIATNGAGLVTVAVAAATRLHPLHAFADECACAASVALSHSGGGGIATAQGTITVSDTDSGSPLMLGPIFTTGVVENTPVPAGTLLASFTSTAAPADLTATITWGDGTPAEPAVIEVGTGVLWVASSVPHTYTDECSCFPVITVSEDSGEQAATWPCGGLNLCPLSVTEADTPVITPGSAAGVEGQSFSPTLATFTDAGYPGNDPADFKATIDWGDGNVTTGVVTAIAGGFAVTATSTYAEEGNYPVAVSISDGAGATASTTTSATITDAPLTARHATAFTVTSGVSFTKTVAKFTDADPGEPLASYTDIISWGDGTTSSGIIKAGTTGYTIKATHTYATPGSRKIHVTIFEESGQSVTATTKVAVL